MSQIHIARVSLVLQLTVPTAVYAQHLAAFRDDPNLIGYFMRNEPKWAFGGRNIASEMLEANPGTETRKALQLLL